MIGPRDTDKWYGRWYVPVLIVAVAFAIVMAIALRTGDAARTRLSTSTDNPFPVASGTGCEPGIGC
jgi:predicted outer membrane lipoprotein